MPLDPSPQRELRRTLTGLEYAERLISGRIEESPFNDHLGIRLVHAAPGEVRLSARARPEHLNKIGSGHGGFVATMLDNACGMAVDTLSPAGTVWTTMDLHVRFFSPVTLESGELSVIGRVDRAGRHVAVSHAEVRTDDGTVLAQATSSLYALDLERGAAG